MLAETTSEWCPHIPDLDGALKALQANLKIGSLVHITVPGIDSLKKGRRLYDFLGEIHQAHVSYFSIEVLTNLMGRYGFKHLKSDIDISALFEYTGEASALVNHHDIVVSHIRLAEIQRILLFPLMLSLARKIVPRSLIIFTRKIFPHYTKKI